KRVVPGHCRVTFHISDHRKREAALVTEELPFRYLRKSHPSIDRTYPQFLDNCNGSKQTNLIAVPIDAHSQQFEIAFDIHTPHHDSSLIFLPKLNRADLIDKEPSIYLIKFLFQKACLLNLSIVDINLFRGSN